MVYFVGVEGGGTKTHAVLFDSNGKLVAEITGPAQGCPSTKIGKNCV